MVHEVLSGGVRGIIRWCKRYCPMVHEVLSGTVRGVVLWCQRCCPVVSEILSDARNRFRFVSLAALW